MRIGFNDIGILHHLLRFDGAQTVFENRGPAMMAMQMRRGAQHDSGEVFIGGVPTSQLDDKGLTRLRRTEIGFVYQFHHLLPEFTALENVVLPQRIRGLGKAEADSGDRIQGVGGGGGEIDWHGCLSQDGGHGANRIVNSVPSVVAKKRFRLA